MQTRSARGAHHAVYAAYNAKYKLKKPRLSPDCQGRARLLFAARDKTVNRAYLKPEEIIVAAEGWP